MWFMWFAIFYALLVVITFQSEIVRNYTGSSKLLIDVVTTFQILVINNHVLGRYSSSIVVFTFQNVVIYNTFYKLVQLR